MNLGNFAIRSLILASLAVISQKSIVQASTFTFIAGVDDNFSTSNGPELSTPLPNLIKYATIQGAYPTFVTPNFDDPNTDKWLLNTFANLPSDITSATLKFRVKPNGGNSDNDSLGLVFTDDAGEITSQPFYFQNFGSLGVPPLTWNTTNYPDGKEFTLDLAALSPSSLFNGVNNLLAGLNSNHFLDIRFQDDTSVDYIQLTVTTTPESSPLVGLGAIVALGVLSNLSKKPKSPTDNPKKQTANVNRKG